MSVRDGQAAAAPVTWVLVPVKSFASAKVRLAPALGVAERAGLARRLAAGVLAAAAPLPAAVVCDDPEVRAWAEAAGAAVVWTPGLGLDGAVEAGVAHLAERGAVTVVVSHADLPLATRLDRFAAAPTADPRPGPDPSATSSATSSAATPATSSVTLVPDRHADGTNVAVVPAAAGFRFAYGPGSFARHAAEAERLGLRLRIVRDEDLGWDLDVPADLVALEQLMAARAGHPTAP
ncbi:MAG: hypothetical protein HYX34_13475 [Actinobacteria bacterium]|nr:hypothetical protein [Actinomycetota bacterium]